MRIDTVQIGRQRLRIGLRPDPGDAAPLLDHLGYGRVDILGVSWEGERLEGIV